MLFDPDKSWHHKILLKIKLWCKVMQRKLPTLILSSLNIKGKLLFFAICSNKTWACNSSGEATKNHFMERGICIIRLQHFPCWYLIQLVLGVLKMLSTPRAFLEETHQGKNKTLRGLNHLAVVLSWSRKTSLWGLVAKDIKNCEKWKQDRNRFTTN